MPPEKALTAGLIVNELVTNAFKYAFDDEQTGHVRVELKRVSGGLNLSVTDNGKGCPKDFEAGLGTRLVTVFATQLGGAAVWRVPPGGGCQANIQFSA